MSLRSSSSNPISISVRASLGEASGARRLIMVSEKILQLNTQKTDIRLTSRSAVRSFDSSALQPDFTILWNNSIFQRNAYHWIFSIASAGDSTLRSVISFHVVLSRAWITVSVNSGYWRCLPIGGRTLAAPGELASANNLGHRPRNLAQSFAQLCGGQIFASQDRIL